ncbi:OLC1v1013573C1 [Oldenlandia corymbosa var. corymbosa]|uniref:OLC1v1013573C1 n=1 Tax=Oldenlandia corymbosa var. corymbosa TaxID=529605 RepID=A0AAV1DYJ3_OLDCO|nr:OLC1v1013573C1 [Oldenlandia corymbosa var. corymbosa]
MEIINIISKELIKPSSPTPSDCRDFKLSFISQRIPHSYFPLILYYPSPQNLNQSETSKWLKKSLSKTLSHFYPMAGRMNDQGSIDCNDEGILFVESRVDGNLLELINHPDVQILEQLVPCKSNGILSHANELLAVQVNYFKCGGIAVGFCHSHRIGDGRTLASFISGWAAETVAAAPTSYNTLIPVLNAASDLFPPRNTLDFRPASRPRVLEPPKERLLTKRFIFSPSTIELLKSQVISSSSSDAKAKPSRVRVVSAYIWKCCMVAEGLGKTDRSVAFHPVDLRRRIDPPLPDSSFGNIFQMAYAEANGGEDWMDLVGILSRAIGKIDEEYFSKLLSENGHELAKSNFEQYGKYAFERGLQTVRFTSWCGFPLCDADFGWGKPIWVSSTSYSGKNVVFLFDSMLCDGGIEAWINMDATKMDKLEEELNMVGGE